MAKTYILDTNVLLHDPKSIFAFQDNEVVIPLAVVEEIDTQKKRQDEIGRNARSVSRILDQLRSLGKLSKGVPLHQGGRLRVEVNHQEAIDFPKGLDPERYDNLEYLFRDGSETFTVLDEFINRGIIEMETLTHIRGRSIPNQFIICDEAQNLSPNMIKTLVTRVGEGTKIVFTGDPEQIDHPYLDASSNGLTYLVERLKAEEISGHVTLTKGERSVVAEMGARLL